MEAKCSSDTVRGIVWEMEMGRWREKKLDKPRARLAAVSICSLKKRFYESQHTFMRHVMRAGNAWKLLERSAL
jgi:hypothetical protein